MAEGTFQDHYKNLNFSGVVDIQALNTELRLRHDLKRFNLGGTDDHLNNADIIEALDPITERPSYLFLLDPSLKAGYDATYDENVAVAAALPETLIAEGGDIDIVVDGMSTASPSPAAEPAPPEDQWEPPAPAPEVPTEHWPYLNDLGINRHQLEYDGDNGWERVRTAHYGLREDREAAEISTASLDEGYAKFETWFRSTYPKQLISTDRPELADAAQVEPEAEVEWNPDEWGDEAPTAAALAAAGENLKAVLGDVGAATPGVTAAIDDVVALSADVAAVAPAEPDAYAIPATDEPDFNFDDLFRDPDHTDPSTTPGGNGNADAVVTPTAPDAASAIEDEWLPEGIADQPGEAPDAGGDETHDQEPDDLPPPPTGGGDAPVEEAPTGGPSYRAQLGDLAAQIEAQRAAGAVPTGGQDEENKAAVFNPAAQSSSRPLDASAVFTFGAGAATADRDAYVGDRDANVGAEVVEADEAPLPFTPPAAPVADEIWAPSPDAGVDEPAADADAVDAEAAAEAAETQRREAAKLQRRQELAQRRADEAAEAERQHLAAEAQRAAAAALAAQQRADAEAEAEQIRGYIEAAGRGELPPPDDRTWYQVLNLVRADDPTPNQITRAFERGGDRKDPVRQQAFAVLSTQVLKTAYDSQLDAAAEAAHLAAAQQEETNRRSAALTAARAGVSPPPGQTWYEILDVGRKAGSEEISDKFASDTLTYERQLAFAVLNDRALKSAYDIQLQHEALRAQRYVADVAEARAGTTTPPDGQTWYQVLDDIPEDASQPQIRQAYELNRDDRVYRKAFAVLSTPDLKDAYDQRLRIERDAEDAAEAAYESQIDAIAIRKITHPFEPLPVAAADPATPAPRALPDARDVRLKNFYEEWNDNLPAEFGALNTRSTSKEIKAAHAQLIYAARQNPDATQRTRRLTDIESMYEVLSNKQKRRIHDRVAYVDQQLSNDVDPRPLNHAAIVGWTSTIKSMAAGTSLYQLLRVTNTAGADTIREALFRQVDVLPNATAEEFYRAYEARSKTWSKQEKRQFDECARTLLNQQRREQYNRDHHLPTTAAAAAGTTVRPEELTLAIDVANAQSPYWRSPSRWFGRGQSIGVDAFTTQLAALPPAPAAAPVVAAGATGTTPPTGGAGTTAPTAPVPVAPPDAATARRLRQAIAKLPRLHREHATATAQYNADELIEFVIDDPADPRYATSEESPAYYAPGATGPTRARDTHEQHLQRLTDRIAELAGEITEEILINTYQPSTAVARPTGPAAPVVVPVVPTGTAPPTTPTPPPPVAPTAAAAAAATPTAGGMSGRAKAGVAGTIAAVLAGIFALNVANDSQTGNKGTGPTTEPSPTTVPTTAPATTPAPPRSLMVLPDVPIEPPVPSAGTLTSEFKFKAPTDESAANALSNPKALANTVYVTKDEDDVAKDGRRELHHVVVVPVDFLKGKPPSDYRKLVKAPNQGIGSFIPTAITDSRASVAIPVKLWNAGSEARIQAALQDIMNHYDSNPDKNFLYVFHNKGGKIGWFPHERDPVTLRAKVGDKTFGIPELNLVAP